MIHEFMGMGEFLDMRDNVVYFYPELEGAETLADVSARLRPAYEGLKGELTEKPAIYQSAWDAIQNDIERAIGEIFELNAEDYFNSIVCRVSMNPVCPRFLEDNSFDIFYKWSG